MLIFSKIGLAIGKGTKKIGARAKVIRKSSKVKSILLSLCIICTTLMVPTPVEAASSVVENAISWAIAIANDNSHGYSQSSRWGPDYDCSSFVISAFRSAGVDTGTATYTGNMKSQFTQHGFQWIPWSQIGGVSNLQRGDILLNEVSHTEIYLGNGQNVGAHSNRGYPQTGDQTGTEISVSGYYNHPWNGVLRYVSTEICRCSTDYAGEYYVSTNSLPLTMRSGHGTGYSVVTSIPKGSRVFVSRADGNWAHVEWNNYSGYCSMQYLKRIEQQAKSYNLHVWVSDTKMGDVPSKFVRGNRYYICYELIDQTTGKKANETSNINYKATETIRNSSGKVFEYTYNNSDCNWISTVCNEEDTYSGTVTISGDVGISCSISFDVWADVAPTLKVWTWESDESNKVTTINAGRIVHCSYLIRDKNTQKNLNDVTVRCIRGQGYTVEVNIYDPNGNVITTKTYKNTDAVCTDFTPDKIGEYKMEVKVSGTLRGTKEIILVSVENEHNFDAWKVIKSPTCTETGVKARTCSICGSVENQTINATGHNMSEWKVTKSATCTTTGVKTRICLTCGQTEKQTIEATGHNMSKWEIERSATCTTDGIETRICVDCRMVESQTIKAEGHDYKLQVVPPTCTEKGYTIHICKKCATSYEDSFVNATGHNYISEITTSATCTSDGIITYTCKVCNEKKTSIIPAIEHDYETSIISPMYDREGYTLHKCKDCGYSYKDTYVESIEKPANNVKKDNSKNLNKKVKVTEITSLKKSYKSLKVKWREVKKASGYQIQYSTSREFKKAKKITIKNSKITSKTITKLNSKKKYYIRIRTYIIVNGKKRYSDWSKKKSQKVKIRK